MKKNNRPSINIRMTQKEIAALKEMAKDRGYTMSELIREKLFGRKVTVRYLDIGKGQREVKEV